MGYGIIRVEKVKKTGVGAMQYHNDRLPGEHTNPDIDPSRTHLNRELVRHGDYRHEVQARIDAGRKSDRKLRKDAVVLVEGIATASPEFFNGKTDEEILRYFEDVERFVEKEAGRENLLHFTIHMDESSPHAHFGFVPLKDGSLSWKKFFDGAKGLHAFQDRYYAEVSSRYGLERGEVGTGRKHKEVAEYKREAVRESRAAKEAAEKAMDSAAAAVAREKNAKAKAERAEKDQHAAEAAAAAAKTAQEAAESRRRDSEAAAEASEKARKQAASDAESAKEDLETQRRRAKQLGPEGKGIDWQYQDGHVEHESSVGEVRAARDAEERLRSVAIKQRETAEADAMSAKLDADSARSEAEAWQAMVRDVQGISYKDEDGHERMGIKGMEQAYAAAQERLKAAQAAETVAVQQAQKAQDAAQGTEQYLAHAKADLQKSLAEAARAKQERDRYARERLIDWTEIDSAIAEVARYVATVVVSLWDSARDFAVSVWQSWRGNWGLSITSSLGYSKQDHENVCDEQMASACEERNRPDIAHALGVDEEREERGYDDWER